MKNSKYIKVSVSERLPEVNKCVKVVDQEDNIYDGFITDKQVWQVYTQFEYGRIEYWLEEKPDYEAEMKEMLEFIYGYGEKIEWSKVRPQLEELLTKLKTESCEK